MPDEPYDPPCAAFDLLAALEAELEDRPDDEELRLLVELMKQREKGDDD